jgi:hypothetical protein
MAIAAATIPIPVATILKGADTSLKGIAATTTSF